MKLFLAFIVLFTLFSCSKSVEATGGNKTLIIYEVFATPSTTFTNSDFTFSLSAGANSSKVDWKVQPGSAVFASPVMSYAKTTNAVGVVVANPTNGEWSVKIKNIMGQVLKEGKPELVGGVYQVHITVQP